MFRPGRLAETTLLCGVIAVAVVVVMSVRASIDRVFARASVVETRVPPRRARDASIDSISAPRIARWNGCDCEVLRTTPPAGESAAEILERVRASAWWNAPLFEDAAGARPIEQGVATAIGASLVRWERDRGRRRFKVALVAESFAGVRSLLLLSTLADAFVDADGAPSALLTVEVPPEIPDVPGARPMFSLGESSEGAPHHVWYHAAAAAPGCDVWERALGQAGWREAATGVASSRIFQRGATRLELWCSGAALVELVVRHLPADSKDFSNG